MSVSQIELFSAIMKNLDKQGVKTLLPRQVNAVIAAADSIIAQINVGEIKAKPGDGLQKWLASDGVGMSSKFMASILSGSFDAQYAHPYDSDDFGRCRRLIEAVPEFAAKINEMAKCSPEWYRLVKIWPELNRLYDAKDFGTVSQLISDALDGK